MSERTVFRRAAQGHLHFEHAAGLWRLLARLRKRLHALLGENTDDQVE